MLDPVNLGIIKILKENARTPYLSIAKELNPITATLSHLMLLSFLLISFICALISLSLSNNSESLSSTTSLRVSIFSSYINNKLSANIP